MSRGLGDVYKRQVETGDVIGTVQETVLVQQKIMVPYGIKGTIKEIKEGKCEEAIRANMALSDAEIREKYNNREIEK